MKLLYICTHNRCRSILSEAITNHYGQGHITAHSAGSQPAGQVHPLSLRYLQEAGIPIEGLTSQSWDEFADYAPDAVITVCDSAAAEACPVWMGNQLRLHWGLQDPSKIQGSEDEIAQGFRDCIALIQQRVEALLAIPFETLDVEQRAAALRQITTTVE